MTAVRDQLVRAIRRPGADDTYADLGDDAWHELPWSEWRRHEVVLDRRVRIVDTGAGRDPIVFVHGLGGNWQNWLLNIGHFAALGHRVIALDLPGHGESEMPREKVSIPVFARTVDVLCERLGTGPVAIVGNSMGGFIGAEIAVSAPARVERLALVSAAILSAEHARREPLVAAARVGTVANRLVVANIGLAVRRPRMRRIALGGIMRYPERFSPALTWELLQSVGTPGYVPALDALLSYRFRPRMAEIGCPTLVVWGREDLLVPVSDAEEFQRAIPTCDRVEIFDDTGHAPMLERPGRFNALIEGFLAGEAEPERAVPGVTASA